MGSERAHVKILRNVDSSSQFLFVRIVVEKSLEVDDQHLWVTPHGHLVLEIVFTFTFGAAITALLHLLFLNKRSEAIF